MKGARAHFRMYRVRNVRRVIPDPAALRLRLAARVRHAVPARHGPVPPGGRPVLEGGEAATLQLR